jgi:hypothetical protein
MFVMGGGSSKTDTAAATTAPAVHTPAKPHTAPIVKPTTKPAKHATRHVTKPVAKPHTATRHHVKAAPPRFHGNPVYAQLPQALQWQLAHHKIVVVSLYNPGSDVDAISVAEAHAGAIDANAGFLLVSVLDNKVAGLLTALLPGGGLLPDPGVLVYRAPGDVALRLDGFADRGSVAQAATNALHGETGPAPVSTAPAVVPVVAPAPTTTTP